MTCSVLCSSGEHHSSGEYLDMCKSRNTDTEITTKNLQEICSNLIIFTPKKPLNLPFYILKNALKKIISSFTIFLPQAGNKFLGWDDSHLLLLCGNTVEEIREAGQEAFLLSRLHLVCQNLLPKGPTEIQGLQDRVAVAGIAELLRNRTQGEQRALH